MEQISSILDSEGLQGGQGVGVGWIRPWKGVRLAALVYPIAHLTGKICQHEFTQTFTSNLEVLVRVGLLPWLGLPWAKGQKSTYLKETSSPCIGVENFINIGLLMSLEPALHILTYLLNSIGVELDWRKVLQAHGPLPFSKVRQDQEKWERAVGILEPNSDLWLLEMAEFYALLILYVLLLICFNCIVISLRAHWGLT